MGHDSLEDIRSRVIESVVIILALLDIPLLYQLGIIFVLPIDSHERLPLDKNT